jgi:hypothetical protein
MTVQCCPLSSSGEGERPSCSTSKIRKARKDHKCVECREVIAAESKYEYTSGIWDGRASTYKTCLACVEIRNHFSYDGWVFGLLWSDMEENFFPDMKASAPCMDGLSPAAKDRLFTLRNAWLGAGTKQPGRSSYFLVEELSK